MPLSEIIRRSCPEPFALTDQQRRLLDSWYYKEARQEKPCNGLMLGALDEVFHTACTVHDMCYRTSEGKGLCDEQLFRNANQICLTPGGWIQGFSVPLCSATAAGMTAAMTHPRAYEAYDIGQDTRAGRLQPSSLGSFSRVSYAKLDTKLPYCPEYVGDQLSRSECAAKCLERETPNCLSFDFHRKTGVCYLNPLAQSEVGVFIARGELEFDHYDLLDSLRPGEIDDSAFNRCPPAPPAIQ